jgi:hypothetical protein
MLALQRPNEGRIAMLFHLKKGNNNGDFDLSQLGVAGVSVTELTQTTRAIHRPSFLPACRKSLPENHDTNRNIFSASS